MNTIVSEPGADEPGIEFKSQSNPCDKYNSNNANSSQNNRTGGPCYPLYNKYTKTSTIQRYVEDVKYNKNYKLTYYKVKKNIVTPLENSYN
jgi:hypothetical protein